MESIGESLNLHKSFQEARKYRLRKRKCALLKIHYRTDSAAQEALY